MARQATRQISRAELETAVETMPPAMAKIVEAHNENAAVLQALVDNNTLGRQTERTAIKIVQAKMPADAPWVLLDLIAPAANAGGGNYAAAYLVEPGGRVSFRGTVNGFTPSVAIATLPATLSTGKLRRFVCDSEDGVTLVRVAVDQTLVATFSTGTVPDADLSPITFVSDLAGSPNRFVAPGWPLILKHGLPRVLGLHVTGAQEVRGVGINAVGAPYVDWDDPGGGIVRIHAIWGLQWGKTYDVRVVLSAEEAT